MPLLNPFGIHRQNMQTPSEDWLLQMCRDCQFTTVTCLDAAALTGRVQSEGGVPYAIYRAWTWEPNPGDRTGEALKQYAREVYGQARNMVNECQNPNVHINVNCEQGHAPQRIRMYTEMMRLNAADPHGPIGLVFLNTFIGTIKTGFWGEPNEFETDHFMEFIKTFDQYRNLRLGSGSYAHVFGVHNYTSQFAWSAVNGGEERDKPINWNTAESIVIDWDKAQDHLGREYQGIRRALKYNWDNSTRQWSASANTPKRADGTPIEPPWIIWTEALFDDVTGIPIYAQPIDHNNRPRGYHSVKTWWENTAFPGDGGHGHTLAKMGRWTWKNICSVEAGDGYTIGWNNYTLGDTGTWESHNTGRTEGTDGGVDPDMDFYDEMKTYRVEMPAHFFSDTDPGDGGDNGGTEPPMPTKIDLLPYFNALPSRRKYELGHNAAMGGGTELLQTQGETADQRIFRHVKQGGASATSKWERLCNTENYIYRDLDTSGDTEVYRLSDAGKPWSKWCPRHMAVGEKFRRNPKVTWHNKKTGVVIRSYDEASDLKLVNVLPSWTSPIEPVVIQDVIVLEYSHPNEAWIERYYYGRNYGLVGWENRDGWKSGVSVAQSPHPAPIPEQLGAWANPPPVPTDSAPPPQQPNKPSDASTPVTFTVTAAYKLRMDADTGAQQIGVLKAGETVTAYRVPETNNDSETWHFIERATTPAGEAAQGYSAIPLPAPIPPDPEPPTEPETFTMQAVFEVPAGTDVATLKAALGSILKIVFDESTKESEDGSS